jgi:alpha,alpha-trehalase
LCSTWTGDHRHGPHPTSRHGSGCSTHTCARSDGADTSFEPFTDEDYRLYVDGKHRDDGVESFLAARGIQLARGGPADPPDRDTVWGLANRKDADFQHVLSREGVKVFPSSVALVHDLQSHGVATAVVSASKNCRRVLEAAGVGDLFSVRVDGIVSEELKLRVVP